MSRVMKYYVLSFRRSKMYVRGAENVFFMGEGAICQVINAYKGRGLLFDPSVRTYPEWNRN